MGYSYLAASTLLATVWALCYKVAARRDSDLRAVNLWVYVGAVLVMAVAYARAGMAYHSQAAALGLATGVGVFISIMSFFYHMRTGLLTVSWTVIGLSVAFPVTASLVIWHEQPTIRQWAGLALIPVSFVFLGLGTRAANRQ